MTTSTAEHDVDGLIEGLERKLREKALAMAAMVKHVWNGLGRWTEVAA
jgi:hypothetical protein